MIADIRDSDGDMIPDYAETDNFNLIPTSFTPLVFSLNLPDDADPAKTYVEFNYSASDPNKIMAYGNAEDYIDNDLQHIPANGMLRIWSTNAQDVRSPASILAAQPGHWVEPNKLIPLNKLPALSGKHLILYIEGVGLSQQTGDHVIQSKVTITK